jgi:NifB/MoaA-like Fe-S oxidoreductase
MAPVLAPLVTRVNEGTGSRADVIAVENGYFGPTVTTAGLLGGEDIRSALGDRTWDAVLLPAEALNDDARFIDDVPLERLVGALAPARVVPAHELVTGFAAL